MEDVLITTICSTVITLSGQCINKHQLFDGERLLWTVPLPPLGHGSAPSTAHPRPEPRPHSSGDATARHYTVPQLAVLRYHGAPPRAHRCKGTRQTTTTLFRKLSRGRHHAHTGRAKVQHRLIHTTTNATHICSPDPGMCNCTTRGGKQSLHCTTRGGSHSLYWTTTVASQVCQYLPWSLRPGQVVLARRGGASTFGLVRLLPLETAVPI